MKKLSCFLTFSLLAGCSSAALPRIPFERPFGEAGVIEQDFVVRKAGRYAVQLRYGFASPAARQIAWAFAGGADGGAPFRAEVHVIAQASPGLPAPLEVVVPAPRLSSWGGDALYADLARVNLAPGTYTLRIRLLDARPPAGVPLAARVVVPYQGK